MENNDYDDYDWVYEAYASGYKLGYNYGEDDYYDKSEPYPYLAGLSLIKAVGYEDGYWDGYDERPYGYGFRPPIC